MKTNIKNPTLIINFEKKCKRCKNDGALPNGYCMACVAKMIKNGEIKLPKIKKPTL